MPAARLRFRDHRMARLVLAALFLLSMTLFLRGGWDHFDELLDGDQYVSTGFGIRWPSLKVDALGPGAERAGLRKGDIVLGVNGRPVQGWSAIFGPVRRARTGDRLLLHVKRAGTASPVGQDVSVPLEPFTYV